MEKKTVRNFLFGLVIGLSFFSFIYVNGHAKFYSNQKLPGTELLQKEVSKEEEEEQEFKLPDVTVLEKIVEIVQNFVPGNR